MALVETKELRNGTLKIVLNDPDNLNAMSEEMAEEFMELSLKLKSANPKPRALILTGAGRAFSAGGNLAMLEAKTEINPDENRSLMLKFYQSFLGILEVNVPLIAAINGHAVGAGLCLASACDIRICTTKAKLGFTFAKLGLHPGMGATFFLPRILGDSMARELLFTGRVIDAAEALKIGLVSRVVEGDKLEKECEAIVAEILTSGPEAVSALVETMRNFTNDPLMTCLQREATVQGFSYASSEFKEGVRATIEKRKPAFAK